MGLSKKRFITIDLKSARCVECLILMFEEQCECVLVHLFAWLQLNVSSTVHNCIFQWYTNCVCVCVCCTHPTEKNKPQNMSRITKSIDIFSIPIVHIIKGHYFQTSQMMSMKFKYNQHEEVFGAFFTLQQLPLELFDIFYCFCSFIKDIKSSSTWIFYVCIWDRTNSSIDLEIWREHLLKIARAIVESEKTTYAESICWTWFGFVNGILI